MNVRKEREDNPFACYPKVFKDIYPNKHPFRNGKKTKAFVEFLKKFDEVFKKDE